MATEKQQTNENNDEYLLKSNSDRFVIFPIKEDKVWDMYKQAVSSFWTPEEVDLENDIEHWKNRLSNDERHFVKTVIAFFAGSDGIVNENIALNFLNEIEIPEVRAFYGFQIAMETIHSEVYSSLIQTYIRDDSEREALFRAIHDIPCIKQKADWCFKYMKKENASFAERLLAFVIVEGIFFSGSFCSIFWLKKRGLMPGLTFSNELISRDEALHCRFGILLYSKLKNRLSFDRVKEILCEAVEIEISFVRDALPVSLIGMNADAMTQYIRFVADYFLTELGYQKLYHTKNPFDFMNLISVSSKTNFFESRVSQYSKSGVGQKDSKVFKMDNDF